MKRYLRNNNGTFNLYDKRKEVKSRGAVFDVGTSRWYIPSDIDPCRFRPWLINYLMVDFEDNEVVKKMGARWDREKTLWYVPPGLDTDPFSKWLMDIGHSNFHDILLTPLENDLETIYFAYQYVKGGGSILSRKIWNLKDAINDADIFFFNRIRSLIRKGHDYLISTVPSSTQNDNSGVILLGKRLIDFGCGENGTHLLVRHTPVEKASRGGTRSFSHHLASIRISNPASVVEKDVLLIDDVTTTGASLWSCQQILLRAGARGVICLSVGRTVETLEKDKLLTGQLLPNCDDEPIDIIPDDMEPF